MWMGPGALCGLVAVALVIGGSSRAEADLGGLADILRDMKRLDEEDAIQNKGTAGARDMSWMSTCDGMVQQSLRPNENYAKEVADNLEWWNFCLAKWMNRDANMNWDYVTDLNEYNKNKYIDESVKYSIWNNQLSQAAQRYKDDDRFSDLDPDTQRQVRLLAMNLDPEDAQDVINMNNAQNEMQEIYSTAQVDGKQLEPGLTEIITKSRDPVELEHVWLGWRDATGPKMRDKYTQFVDLKHKGARENGYEDFGDAWLIDQFDSDPVEIRELSERLWQELKPYYELLHAYVRRRLQAYYKRHHPHYHGIVDSGGIPAHLLGNMWAQQWGFIYDIVKPFPEVKEPDYDERLLEQGYDVDRLFSEAELFYKSIGLAPMTQKFNDLSMKTRPEDGREVVCHASAEDFITDDDFRIKMCTEVNMDYFETIHHEMGHIEYFMAYRGQPTIYRSGANSAFHEAIGDTISLSVMSRTHLEKLGLADEGPPSKSIELKRDINFLMKQALDKIAFLPFGYMIDKWRWDVFNGETPSEHYNRHWWDLRLEYQGITAPVPRSEADFDPGAKFHIPANSPYICYFISFISQFQFYEAMCDASNHKGDLYTCDFYQSKEAGDKLRSMLELGQSLPWKDAMERLTGTREVKTDSIKRYFNTLFAWLELETLDEEVGWPEATVNWKHGNMVNPFNLPQ